METTNTETPTLIKRRVTLYFRGEFFGNIKKVEATAYSVRTVKYAQYSNAVEIRFVPKGKRAQRAFVQTYRPDLLILEGWGHLEPDSPFQAARMSASGVAISEGRHFACSEGWAEDFAAKIEPYIAARHGIVLADYRGHNAH